MTIELLTREQENKKIGALLGSLGMGENLAIAINIVNFETLLVH